MSNDSHRNSRPRCRLRWQPQTALHLAQSSPTPYALRRQVPQLFPLSAMNSDDLALFLLIAQSGSLSAAALKQGHDVSKLSRQLKHLEASLGCRLFHRSGRGLVLTPHGLQLQHYALQIQELMGQASTAMQQLQDRGPAALHIAAQPTIAKTLFAHLFHALQTEFPHTHIHFSEGLASGLLDQLQQGAIDAAILYQPSTLNILHYEPLATERLCLITPASFRAPRQRWYLEHLEGIPLILPSTKHGLRLLLASVSARNHFPLHIAIESDSSIDITLELVRQVGGCTVLPLAAALADVQQGLLQAFPLHDPEAARSIAFVAGKTTLATNHLWQLRQIVLQQIQGLIQQERWPGAQLQA